VVAGLQSPLTDSRILVFDGQPPFVDAPPSVQATVGAPLVVAIQASDDSSVGVALVVPPDDARAVSAASTCPRYPANTVVGSMAFI
jgi:hypothetical protein